MSTPVFGIREALAAGWAATRDNASFLVLTAVICLPLVGVLGLSGLMPFFLPFTFLGNLVVYPLLGMGLRKAILTTTDGGTPSLSQLFSQGNLLLNAWGVMLCSFALVLALAIPLVVLLVVAGISVMQWGAGTLFNPRTIALMLVGFAGIALLMAIRFAFVQWVLVDKGLGPVECFKESARISRGRGLKIVGFGLTLMALNLLGLCCFVIGLVITLPVSLFAMAWVYRSLESSARLMDLQTYIQLLEKEGELHRVTCEVDPELEITEIAQRQVRAGGPALLFENVKGSTFPLAINLNATRRRLVLGLGAEPGELGDRLADMVKALQPPRLSALWEHRKTLARALSMRVKRLGSAPVQEVVGAPGDLTTLPALKCWPKDGGRFITLPLVGTAAPGSSKQNLGMYRMQIYGPQATGMHWQIVRGAEAQAHGAGKKSLPCAVALGGDPALTLSAIFPLPEDMEELPFAGLLRGSPQKVVRARTQPLWVPADAEFILEGSVDLQDRRREGPFGDHFGHYSHAAPYPTFKLTALTHRRNAVYPATVVGKPPQEDKVWGEAVNEFAGGMLKLMHPEIAGLWTYFETGFHNLLVVAVHQRHRKEAIKTALGLLGQGQLSLCKVVMMVDAGCDPADFRAVLREAARHFDPREDVLLLPGTPLDTLDFTSFTMNLGSKLILDFTSGGGITPPGGGARKAPVKPFNPDLLKRICGSRFRGWASLEDTLLAVKVQPGPSGAPDLLEAILKKTPLGPHKMVALVSPDVDEFDAVDLLWGIFTRFDAARDMQFTSSRLFRAWPLHEGALGIDATWKKGYPDPLVMPKQVTKKVDSRWKDTDSDMLKPSFKDRALEPIWDKVQAGKRLTFDDGLVMLKTPDLYTLGHMANGVAEKRHGKKVTYVLNRQCNPTNLCVLDCKFCEFARRKGEEGGWSMTMQEVFEHCEGNINEIHIVGGLNPDWGFDVYVDMVRQIRQRYPRLGIKAWTAVEIEWFSRIAKTSIRAVLQELRDAGLDMLPGGGAEVFSERVRKELFKPKIGWDKWREVHLTAHQMGIKSNSTLLYGHIETYEERIDHMVKLRALQDEAPGFLSFIPLAFQPGNTGIPVNRAGAMEDARTLAASRLMLDNFDHIKAYWVMLGAEMASMALNFGASDLDGTIGKEKIVHMAGASSPEGLAIESMRKLCREVGKQPQERDIFYNPILPPEPVPA